jgi:hypothetical protein
VTQELADRYLRPLFAARKWNAGRKCRACGVVSFHSRWTRYGQAISHLRGDGSWVFCSGYADPLYRCACGNQKRSHSGSAPRGWSLIKGLEATCPVCKRKAAADLRPLKPEVMR